MVCIVTEAKEREHFRERLSTIATSLRAGTERKEKKSLLLNLTINQKIQIKTRRYHCSTTRWLRFSRLIISSVGKDRGRVSLTLLVGM